MIFKNKYFQLCLALGLGVIILLLPRPEGVTFKIVGDRDQLVYKHVANEFELVSEDAKTHSYKVKAVALEKIGPAVAEYLKKGGGGSRLRRHPSQWSTWTGPGPQGKTLSGHFGGVDLFCLSWSPSPWRSRP